MSDRSTFDINSYTGTADLSGDVGLRENGSGGLTTQWTQPTTVAANPINFGYIPSNTTTAAAQPETTSNPNPAPSGPPNPNTTYVTRNGETKKLSDWLGEGIDPYASPDAEANRLRGEISSDWDAYINDIPNSMQYFNQQGNNMMGRAENFKTENTALLQDNKAQSLRDMQKTARAALQAGNNYLGQLGAGDSSARDMYGYAINKQQQQQQGELDRFSIAEERKINSQYQEQVFGIQQWLSQQQQALVEAQREGRLQKGRDLQDISRTLLNNALNAVATAKQNAEARKSALMQWAADNSLNAGQLQTNMAAIGQPMGEFQTYSSTSPTAPGFSSSYSAEDELI